MAEGNLVGDKSTIILKLLLCLIESRYFGSLEAIGIFCVVVDIFLLVVKSFW